jgi:ferrochelatase
MKGVALFAYGTPRDSSEIEAYYTDIRRGRPPTPEQLADLVRRYDAIGGVSPLRQRTEAQATRLQDELDRRQPGEHRVVLGYKHAEPSIEDAVRQLALDGIEQASALVLAPHYSRLSVGEYLDRAASAATGAGISLRGMESWHLEPAYLSFLANDITAKLGVMPEATKVLFTAHSLPARIVGEGDPYPDQLRETAEAVAALAGLDRWAGWGIAWQSAGRTPEPWLGPDVTDVIRQLGDTGAAEGVLVCPCGFTSDHLEVLFDLDIEARRVADESALTFGRVRVVNDDPGVFAALADRIVS